jgi:metal-dependent amidase/aminoacylase/carboxypeptidase family protein
MTQSALSAELKRYEPELVAIRHDIHRHPEVGFEETRTAKLVADRLQGCRGSPARASNSPYQRLSL